jgi:hypothetical protein
VLDCPLGRTRAEGGFTQILFYERYSVLSKAGLVGGEAPPKSGSRETETSRENAVS